MPEPDDDVACVTRCLRGDAAAFEPLVGRYQRVLFAVALRLVGDYEDARDATQNTFVRAYVKLETYDPDRRFFSWIYRIAINECLNLRRSRRPHEALTDRASRDRGPLEHLEASERRTELEAAMGQLNAEHREVIMLRHFSGLSYREIGEAVGVPDKTVKSRLFEARQVLAGLLRPRDGGES